MVIDFLLTSSFIPLFYQEFIKKILDMGWGKVFKKRQRKIGAFLFWLYFLIQEVQMKSPLKDKKPNIFNRQKKISFINITHINLSITFLLYNNYHI